MESGVCVFPDLSGDFAMRNPYTVLGVPTGADPQVIRRAYKTLAVKYHPDRNDSPEAVARFKEVSEAYAVLTNDRERKRYARRRRQEHAAREAHRRRAAEAAQRRSTERKSETAAAAERAFWEYARQVQARRQQATRSQTARPQSTRSRQSDASGWGDRINPLLATILIAVYLWQSAHQQPLQPWLPSGLFATHALSSPIWITLGLGLLMVVRPRWCRIPIVMDEIKDVRLCGWAMLLLPPLLSSGVLKLAQLGSLSF